MSAIGISEIIRIGMRVVANREKIAQTWGELAPLIRDATRLSPQIKDLIEKVVPDVVATAPPEPAPDRFSVKWLQESLNKLDNAGLEVDGDYGELTRAAVRKYQERHGLEVDGWAGINTQSAINQELGG